MTIRRRFAGRLLVVVAVLAAVNACSSTSDEEKAREQQLATEFVASLEAAMIAPRMTVELAEDLYGTDATTICDAFDGGTSTAGDLILRGNTAQGRRKTITDEAVEYAALVIETYCPDVAADFRRTVADIDPFETDR
jgi:hypothetical protein